MLHESNIELESHETVHGRESKSHDVRSEAITHVIQEGPTQKSGRKILRVIAQSAREAKGKVVITTNNGNLNKPVSKVDHKTC